MRKTIHPDITVSARYGNPFSYDKKEYTIKRDGVEIPRWYIFGHYFRWGYFCEFTIYSGDHDREISGSMYVTIGDEVYRTDILKKEYSRRGMMAMCDHFIKNVMAVGCIPRNK